MATSLDDIFGASPAIEALRAQLARLVRFDAPGNPRVPSVLLLGETGTGKGLVARVMHASGPRANGPFIDVNCAAIPESMLEAELFGFEAGAFTDARRSKPGLFEAASGGILFLDEIDSLSGPVQGKVLKAIEEKQIRRLGGVEARTVDIKLITATQNDLRAMVESGRFRADLYHRLAVLVLTLPPLRARGDDVLLLAESFLQSCAVGHGLPGRRLSDDARDWLRRYPFPGNVRELGHLIERVTLLDSEATITAAALEAFAEGGAAITTPAPVLESEDDEAERIRAALARCNGNVVQAARLLGLGRNALRYRMRRLQIERPAEPAWGSPSAISRPRAAAAIPPPATTPTLPSWEQKSVAVLAVSFSFPVPHTSDEVATFEEWTETARWQRGLAERIEGFGATIIDRSATRLIAVFGVPRALEQLPQRAIQAAASLHRSVARAPRPHPEIRTAVHVGELRVDTAAPSSEPRLLPLGDTVSLGERLLGHASPGEVLASAAAARRVERSCSLRRRSLQMGSVEGDRTDAYSVVALLPERTLADFAPVDGTSPFVGRRRELELLLDAAARARSGQGQVVFVAGEAGMGKSRLIAELHHRLINVHDRGGLRWLEGRCAPYGTTTPFLPVIDGMRRFLGITDEDDENSTTTRLLAESERLGDTVAWTVPHLRQMLSLTVTDSEVLQLDSASRRSELFRALRALLLRDAEIQPLVVLVEDLHWIDPASEELFGFLAEAIAAARILLIFSHRTGYRHPFGDRSYYTRINLPPLSAPEMAAISGSLLRVESLPPALCDLVAQKAEGNPFYVEELTRSLLEDGTLRRDADDRIVIDEEIASVSVPQTIQEVLLARIDRLAEESRRAIQIASVIGREFALRLLARISESGEQLRTHIDELRTLELIYEKSFTPELAYMFKHALTHDVAYDSVALERRRHLHRIIGLAIEELYADRLAEHYETLALHFRRAEDWQRAARYHELSAEKAAETFANRAAIQHYRHALEAGERSSLTVTDEWRARMNERLARCHYLLSEYDASGAAYEQAAQLTSEPGQRALALAVGAFSHLWGHDYVAGDRCLEQARALTATTEASAAAAMIASVEGFQAGVLANDLTGYEQGARRAIEICARSEVPPVEALAYFNLAQIAEWSGRYREAIRYAEQALTLARRERMPDVIIFATWFLGKARCCTGDYGGAISLLRDAYDLCDRIGDRAWKSRMLNTLGWCFAEIGSFELARQHNERGLELAHQFGDPEIISNAAINLAGNHLALGDCDRALGYLEPIEATLEGTGDPWMRWRYAMHAYHMRAEIEIARGRPQMALDICERERAAAGARHSSKIETRALLSQARAWLAIDDRERASAAARNARTIAEGIGYRRAVWQSLLLLSEIERRLGNARRAEECASSARAELDAAAQSLEESSLRRTLLAQLPG